MEKKKVENVEKLDVRKLYGQKCTPDPLKDTMELVPDLGVNIDDMLQTGVVKDSGETLDNNGIDDPNEIIGRVRDVFDALDSARVIKKYGKKSPSKAQSEIQNISDNASNEPR